jgi:hypothetical protein
MNNLMQKQHNDAKVVHGIYLPGLQNVIDFFQLLVSIIVPSQDDLLKAGVYLNERRDRLTVNGEESIYENMRRSNDERTDLLSSE